MAQEFVASVTIPLKEYEELRRIKETLKTKNYVVLKTHHETYYVHTENSAVEWFIDKLEYANKYIGRQNEKIDLCRTGKIKPSDLYY